MISWKGSSDNSNKLLPNRKDKFNDALKFNSATEFTEYYQLKTKLGIVLKF